MERLRIAFFGPANSGKSTLVNAIAGQEVSLVSPVPGTTTDPVRKPIELPGLGPCVLIDTAGLDDASLLGAERGRLTRAVLDEADIAVLVLPNEGQQNWKEFQTIRSAGIPAITYRRGESVESLLQRIREALPREETAFLTGDLVEEGDTVLLVMPQDSEAPKGRLILPQVQVLRELLDRRCNPLCCTPQSLETALAALRRPPRLTITDSQVFAQVAALLPEDAPLTSFSVLLAAAKGDPAVFMEGARAIGRLNGRSRVLIAEACTHVPDSEDIGRVKIPALLRRRIEMAGQARHDEGKARHDERKDRHDEGKDRHDEGMRIEMAAGNDFPDDLSPYDLIIHCGACMAGRNVVRARMRKALLAGVPFTNYGIALAYLQGILERVVIPGPASRKEG